MEPNLNSKVNGVDVLSGSRTLHLQQFYLGDLFSPWKDEIQNSAVAALYVTDSSGIKHELDIQT